MDPDGEAWELGRSNLLLNKEPELGEPGKRTPRLGNRELPALAESEHNRAAARYQQARDDEAWRDGMLEVLAERSTEGRLSGQSPERSGRWGSEWQSLNETASR